MIQKRCGVNEEKLRAFLVALPSPRTRKWTYRTQSAFQWLLAAEGVPGVVRLDLRYREATGTI